MILFIIFPALIRQDAKLPNVGIFVVFLGNLSSYCFLISLCNRNLSVSISPCCLIRDCHLRPSAPTVSKGCDSMLSGPLVCRRAAPFSCRPSSPVRKPELSVTVCRKCLSRQPDGDAKKDLLPSGWAGLRRGLYRTGRPQSQH